jgi:hypothetical protein
MQFGFFVSTVVGFALKRGALRPERRREYGQQSLFAHQHFSGNFFIFINISFSQRYRGQKAESP